MAFDQATRNRLAAFVSSARALLSEEFTRQLQQDYGIDPARGEVADLERLSHLDDARRETARILRDTLAHYEAGSPTKGKKARVDVLQRIVREQAFTVLNRLCALRMAEARGLLIESVARGYQSDGFQLYQRLAGSALGEIGESYRGYLLSIFDELAVDLAVLFDRFSPQGRLFPREAVLIQLLAAINDAEMAPLWGEDEAIGWVYQYFNSSEERRQMRAESSAPRNSRELAVRNQFFTPRYVVEFLTDNTLGRTWYEMRKGETSLIDECRYLVRRPNEVFLGPGECAAPQDSEQADLSQEELLQQPVYLEHRPLKDPRDLKILDPACGSGHFLLYAFDLLQCIYQESWEAAAGPESECSGHSLRSDYATFEELQRHVPRLIFEHNLHGIDIDPRAVQIAALALWLRAQRAWKELGIAAVNRPRITRSHIVTAEPMPGDAEMLREFVAGLQPKLLGQIVEVVFEEMKLAGEAGSLLKIEAEIQGAIAAAKQQWLAGPKYEQGALFPGLINQPPRQQEFRFDLQGISDESFWEQAEDRILEALKEYAELGVNGKSMRRRLFSEDAAQGFAFVNLCRKSFDVVVMNPPFGGFAKRHNAQARQDYPNSYNDIYAAFTERWYWRLNEGCSLGAITSRVGFFLVSFKRWRMEFLISQGCLSAIVDLGEGVMDDAMVEAAAYVLNKKRTQKETFIFRLLCQDANAENLSSAIEAMRNGDKAGPLFITDLKSCVNLPNSPFVYWIDPAIVVALSKMATFETAIGEVRCGLSTGDNYRFVRLLWEVAAGDFQERWFPLVMSGASQPWFSPILVVVDWKNEGGYLAAFEGSTIRSREFYFRPGFSWTRRAVRFVPYAVPAGCIPSASRYQAFPSLNNEFVALGLSASNMVSSILRFYGEKFKWPNFLVDNVKSLPWPNVPDGLEQNLIAIVQKEVGNRRRAYQNIEPFQEFVAPSPLFNHGADGAMVWNKGSILGEDIDQEVASGYGLSACDYEAFTRDLREAIAAADSTGIRNDDSDDPQLSEGDIAITRNSEDCRDDQEALLSYVVGGVIGRWDMRIAKTPLLSPFLPGPFEPLPVCPPGMLIGPDGLPAEPGGIVSEEWLRARPDAITLPPEGAVRQPTIADDEYPLRISWNGILVDDAGYNDARPHQDDILRRVRQVLDLLWEENAGAIEQEACEILGINALRDYFRKPSGFFDDHLKRYSKSRRKAPIYWPLSTASGTYTLWLYYHRLSDQILYTCVNDYVDPKLMQVAEDLQNLQQKPRRSRDEEGELEYLAGLELELKDLRQELLRIARFWKPNLNDGVQITAAPLYRLFGHRAWQNVLRDTWEKLESGDYDWAHLALSLWPERVREKCKADKSLAIAHDLEQLYGGD